MPGFDRTGPLGRGPMTGGGWGLCGRAAAGRGYGAGWRRFVPGGGSGFGRGFRSLWGRGFFGSGWPFQGMGPAAGMDEEKEYLRAQAAELKTELAGLEKRLADLEKTTSAEPRD
ncbi:MAG: DUF5320 domain-containing protein [Thermodesulfobacteriota bacterium]